MQELDQTWTRTAAVWWLIVWRGAISGSIIGFALGVAIGVVGALIGFRQQEINVVGNLLIGFFVGGLWMLVIVRMAIKKSYRGFRIAFVARDLS